MRSRAKVRASSVAAGAGLHRGIDLAGRDPQGVRLEIEPVEFARGLEQRRVAARGDVIDDGARRRLDIGRNLALGRRENAANRSVEIGAASLESDGHGAFRTDAQVPQERRSTVRPATRANQR